MINMLGVMGVFPKTTICSLLKIDYPIIQGGMAWIGTAELAAAISNAGCLGVIGAGSTPPEILRQEIRKAKELTSKPFGVNLIMWEPFYSQQLEVVCEEKVPVITTGFGDPLPLVSRVRQIGSRVISVVNTPDQAAKVEQGGVDAVVASGWEGGGHVGSLSTLIAVQTIRRRVKIPVVAAGGFCDGKGLVAALALGASGIQMGTRFILTREAPVHPNFKRRLLQAGELDTVVTGIYTGKPMRCVHNRFSEEWLAKERADVPPEELVRWGVGKIRKSAIEGDIDNGSVPAGQVVGLIGEELTVAELVEQIVAEARETLEFLANG